MFFHKISNQLIYVSALDWGLGHLARTSAILSELSKRNEMIIFSTDTQLPLYSKLFPHIKQVRMPSYNINFFPDSIFHFLLTQSYPFFKTIQTEKRFLHTYIQSHAKPDLIISDNRYGFYYPKIRSVIVCHQLRLPLPFVFHAGNYFHQSRLNRFDEIWVPDYEALDKSLAGKLSHTRSKSLRSKLKYILPQSLMRKKLLDKTIDYLFIISGTIAERQYYEKVFLHYVETLQKKDNTYVIKIIGSIQEDGNVLMGWKSFEESNNFILQSKSIVTRAGYSTLMDLHYLMDEKQKLFLVDSQYQYEQKYLFRHWIEKGWAESIHG